MRGIVSSTGSAASSIHSLQSTINALHGKTIYVTTVRRTVGGGGGTVSAATGFSGVVTQPTTFHTGEGNRPEFVQVTPLSQAGGRLSMNTAAANSMKGTNNPIQRAMGNMFQQPKIRAGGSSGKRTTDTVFIMPNGSMYALDNRGNIKISDWKGMNEFDDPRDWTAAARKKSKKFKGLKGAEALEPTGKGKGKRDEPTKHFLAKGAETFSSSRKLIDPLRRNPIVGGITGRGGRSLFDLGLAKGGPNGKNISYVVEEKRYADGSFYRRYNSGAIEFGKDKVPKKKKNKKAATGFSGLVSTPTQFTVGEKGSEYVDVRPINQSGSGGSKGGGSGGRPVIIEEHIHNYMDSKQVSESVRKHLLKGIYSMT